MRAENPEKLSAIYALHLAGPDRRGFTGFDGPPLAGMTIFAHFPLSTNCFGAGNQGAQVDLSLVGCGGSWWGNTEWFDVVGRETPALLQILPVLLIFGRLSYYCHTSVRQMQDRC